MADYIYECPVCNNPVELTIDMQSCPFQWSLVGQCKFCNLKIDIFEDDYKEAIEGVYFEIIHGDSMEATYDKYIHGKIVEMKAKVYKTELKEASQDEG